VNRWWLDNPRERFWVETLSERRPTLGRQLHAPQVDDSGRESWRYTFVTETRPGDAVLHWLRGDREHGFVGWSVVDGPAEPRPIEWQARGTYGRRRRGPTPGEEPGWWAPLRDFTELPRPIGLADLNADRAAIEGVYAHIRDIYGSPLYLALTLYQGRRGVEVGQGYMFKWPAELNAVFEGLRGMDQLMQGEPTELDDPVEPVGEARRRPRRRDQRRLKAAELHAMEAAKSWYTAQGYAVEDVSSRKSWDLEATRGEDVRRIEVKGSARVRDAVDLTANEVRNARGWSPTDLFVVDQIELRENGATIQTSGGRARLWSTWRPTSESLQPLMYSHLLPDDPKHSTSSSRSSTARTTLRR
jgi:hypothetical protein